MALQKLREFLDSRNIKYTVISHSRAFTAREIALTAHVPAKEIAKSVIVKADDRFIMTVVPASDMVDLKTLKKSLGAATAGLAVEEDFKGMFPDCEPGAMPPFGNLFNMEVIVSDDLRENQQIAFNAGTHHELVKMAYKDFEQLVQPRRAKVGVKRKSHEDEGAEYYG